MASVINASSSGAGGLVSSGDSSGVLQLQNNGSTSVTLDTSGNVGIGTSSPSTYGKLAVVGSGFNGGNANFVSTSSGNSITVTGVNGAGVNDVAYYNFTDGTNNAFIGLTGTNATAGALRFATGTSPTERMRIDTSGNLLFGQTASGLQNSNSQSFSPAGANVTFNHSNTSGGFAYLVFGYNGSSIGSITQNGTTGVLYNLTSDYRLKNDQQPLTGAKEFVMALQPKKWQWWDGSGEGVGFIAHEFMEVAKYSGHGEKDAVDAEGKPMYQSIQPSSSEVMANLVAFIQEQQALITQLQADVAALKSK